MSGYVDPLIQRLDVSLVVNGLTLASLEHALASFGCLYNYEAMQTGSTVLTTFCECNDSVSSTRVSNAPHISKAELMINSTIIHAEEKFLSNT